jgi:S1-C subfamily serine protease
MVINAQPENDLAVIQAGIVPEGPVTPTITTTGEIKPGERLVAVSHPFGIGDSVSAGLISGLGRVIVAPAGESALGRPVAVPA